MLLWGKKYKKHENINKYKFNVKKKNKTKEDAILKEMVFQS